MVDDYWIKNKGQLRKGKTIFVLLMITHIVASLETCFLKFNRQISIEERKKAELLKKLKQKKLSVCMIDWE